MFPMLHVDADAKERQDFTEQSIKTASDALKLPEVAIRMRQGINGLRHLASRLVVPYIIGDEIRLPKSSKRIDDVVPVIALQPGESIVLGKDFGQPTLTQTKRAIEMIDSWKPIGFDGRAQVEAMVSKEVDESEQLTFEANARARATAFAAAIVFSPEKEKYQRAPAQDVGWLTCQPLLVLTWTGDMPHEEPDLVAHELAHIAQKLNRPIRLFGSQEDVVRDRMRDELEAYHVGANVRIAIEPDILDPVTNPISDTGMNMQVAIEATRLDIKDALGELQTDPFGPSKLVMRKMDQRFGLERIVHYAFDYESVRAQLLASQDQDTSTQP